ncbi:MAG: arylesterase [Nevskia sp.]|nr:arylesterase [Nevskia sp.]
MLLSLSAWSAPTLMVFGDSLSAGYGLDPGSGWVALLDTKLKAQSSPALKSWSVINVSVSGETTAGGLSRLPAALAQYHPQMLLIELGGNDGLRGQPLAAMRANLEKMIDLGVAAKAQPVLMEMRIPSNYGPAYTDKFVQTYAEIAQQRQVPLLPFFLAPLVADRPHWFQDDGIHPNAAAQPLLLDSVWPGLQALLAHPSRP